MKNKTWLIYANISEKDKKIISDFLENNISKKYHYSWPEINNINRNHTDSNIMIIDWIIDDKNIRPEIYNFCDVYKNLIIKNFHIELQNFWKEEECKVLQIVFESDSKIYNIQKKSKKFKYYSKFEWFLPIIKRNIAFVKNDFNISLLWKLPMSELQIEWLYYYDY